MTPRTASLYRRRISGGSERQSHRRGGLVPLVAVEKESEGGGGAGKRRLTRMLVKVTVERSLGAVPVVMSSEETVADLVRAALQIYVTEKRRPLLPKTDPHRFELHYSRFSFESLKPEEKLINLETRDFFMCLKPVGTSTSTTSSVKCSCSEEATNFSFPWTKLMDFLL